MSLPNIMSVLNNALYRRSFTNGASGKKLQFTANTLENNTLVYVSRRDFGKGTTEASDFLILRDGKKQDQFASNTGTIEMVTILKPDYENGEIVVGAGDSLDPNDNFVAARLSVAFGDAPPTGVATFNTSFNGQPVTLMNPSQIPADYYINLKDLAAGKRYCRLTVDTFKLPDETIWGALENSVILHLMSGNSVGLIYNKNPSKKDQGAPWDDIFNRDFYIDFNNYPMGIYLFAFIQYQQNPDGSIKFEIGDPKTDAAVSVDEV